MSAAALRKSGDEPKHAQRTVNPTIAAPHPPAMLIPKLKNKPITASALEREGGKTLPDRSVSDPRERAEIYLVCGNHIVPACWLPVG
jgi:hypothetical protein